MKFFNKTTANPPTWARGQITGSSSQLDPEAGARPMFSDPLDEDVYDDRFDRRQGEYISTKDIIPTDTSIGGEDA
jgi:hypothetical protein